MAKIYINQATLDELNAFSCKIEILRNNIELLHSLIWGGILEGDAKAVDRAAALVEMLLDVAYLRDQEFSELVHDLEGRK
jgi:hypothetical protein